MMVSGTSDHKSKMKEWLRERNLLNEQCWDSSQLELAQLSGEQFRALALNKIGVEELSIASAKSRFAITT